MWLLFACGSALFAGVTAVLAKIGMQHINSTIATALRTIIVLLFSWLMVLLTGAFSGIGSISGKTLVFLLLSGCALPMPSSSMVSMDELPAYSDSAYVEIDGNQPFIASVNTY